MLTWDARLSALQVHGWDVPKLDIPYEKYAELVVEQHKSLVTSDFAVQLMSRAFDNLPELREVKIFRNTKEDRLG